MAWDGQTWFSFSSLPSPDSCLPIFRLPSPHISVHTRAWEWWFRKVGHSVACCSQELDRAWFARVHAVSFQWGLPHRLESMRGAPPSEVTRRCSWVGQESSILCDCHRWGQSGWCRITRWLVWTHLSHVVVSFRHTKFRAGYLWRVGSGQKMFSIRWGWWIQTPPRWWSAHFHSWLGLCFHHLEQLSQIRQGLACFLSASWEPQWRVGSVPSVDFFFNDQSCEFFGSFPLPLLHVICAWYHTFIPECPSGFSIRRTPWSSISIPYVFSSKCLSTSCSYLVSQRLGNWDLLWFCPCVTHIRHKPSKDSVSVFTLHFFTYSQCPL